MRLLSWVVPLLLAGGHAEGCASRGGTDSWGQQSGQERPLPAAPPAIDKPALAQEGRTPKELLINVGELAPIRLIYIEPASFNFGIRYAKKRSLKYWYMSLLMRKTTDMGPKHRVTITKGFYLAQMETRVDLYCAFLNDVKDAEQYIGDNLFCRIEQRGGLYAPKPGAEACPVNTVPWAGAQAFCDWLSQKTGRRFRLPTEAEWELAAYGTEKRRYAWGDDGPRATMEEVVQYYGPYHLAEPWSCAPVGSRPKNVTPDGLFDMTSVTAEWVSDWYAREYDVDDNVDPQGPVSGQWKVLRGEHFDRRRFFAPSFSGTGYLGFRLLMEVDKQAD